LRIIVIQNLYFLSFSYSLFCSSLLNNFKLPIFRMFRLCRIFGMLSTTTAIITFGRSAKLNIPNLISCICPRISIAYTQPYLAVSAQYCVDFAFSFFHENFPYLHITFHPISLVKTVFTSILNFFI